jgi:LAO/AO transport system kinase
MERPLQTLVDEVRAGGPRALRAAARLMSVMADEPQRLAELLVGSADWPQPRLVLGVTGAPGSGKSTLVDRLATEFRSRWPDRRLGILAVDPSSPFTGGALLGDRVRMMRHATDPGVFIRSLATRGRLGGLALGAKGVVRVMGLLGCYAVIVETVGVGQCEIDIARHADLTAVVLAPGQGDSIQLLKAGLLEAGDLFLVNKADREEAARLHQQLLASMELDRQVHHDSAHRLIASAPHVSMQASDRHETPTRQAYLCSSLTGQGIPELVADLISRADDQADVWRDRRRGQVVDELRDAVLREVESRCDALLDGSATTAGRLARVLGGEATVADVADELLGEAIRRTDRGSQPAPCWPRGRCQPTHLAAEGN